MENGSLVPPVTWLPDLGHPPGRVALTFDDGPCPPWTDRLLDVLARTGTPATFFVLGSLIAGREDRLRRMVRLGCAVQVHGWEHVRMTEQSPRERRRDIAATRRLICDVTGHRPRLVRPPEGRADRAVIEDILSMGMAPAFWSVHAADWTRPGRAEIVARISPGLVDGAVVLLHDGGGERDQTVGAVGPLVALLRERGLAPVTLTP
ncbi:polysaccharide deacetylase family protein [Plantactinospora sp. KBS50]|uniref:polysaccharide deacetylase family protein n=1 Tax=Plantactinospora sp. KBS50 TaxID=2024580 RepID=UPI0012FDF93D|nr:polysaccharide deacetylase family protein [Plantactinospora sp. KBS50]